MTTIKDRKSFSSADQAKAWVAEANPPFAAPATAAEIAKWKPRFRKKLASILCIDERPAMPEVEVLSRRVHGDLNAYELFITPPGELGWRALLLEPKGLTARRPAWVCMHGVIKGGMSSVTGLVVRQDGGEESLREFECEYGLKLAQMGYVTLSFDFPGFGYRADTGSDGTVQDGTAVIALDMGKTYIGWCVSDGMAAVSALTRWPTVDPRRIGATGFSMGGTMAGYLGALDRRLYTVALSGRFGYKRHRLLEGRNTRAFSCVPGMHKYMDGPDVLASIAPKRMYINQEVRNDMPLAVSETERVRAAYEALGAADRLAIQYDAPQQPRHRFGGAPVYEWMRKTMPI
ncbi:MAG: hypothetical protein FJ319_09140 [SAR202 cluster bacterium]|nr:hypothetical protein [SAR202 cluster bacterium]